MVDAQSERNEYARERVGRHTRQITLAVQRMIQALHERGHIGASPEHIHTESIDPTTHAKIGFSLDVRPQKQAGLVDVSIHIHTKNLPITLTYVFDTQANWTALSSTIEGIADPNKEAETILELKEMLLRLPKPEAKKKTSPLNKRHLVYAALLTSLITACNSSVSAATLYPPTQSVEQISAPQQKSELEKTNIPQPEIISEVVVYGEKEAIDQEGFELLKSEFKKQIIEKSREYDKYTVYATVYITEDAYAAWKSRNADYFSFINKHIQWLNSKVQYIIPGGVVLREVIVVKNGINVPMSLDVTQKYEQNKLPGTDGTFLQVDPNYDGTSGYYDESIGIDRGEIHELAHKLLLLPDDYSLDVNPKENMPIPAPLQDIPKHWQTYHAGYRNDLSRGNIMGTGVYDRFLPYSEFLLKTRVIENRVHDYQKSLQECLYFTAKFPQNITMRFFDKQGQHIQIDHVEIYGTQSDPTPTDGYGKKIVEQPKYIGGIDNIDPISLFEVIDGNVVQYAQATLFVKIYGIDGSTYFRWLDIRDFHLPYMKGYRDKVTLNMNAIPNTDNETNDHTFDATVGYSQ